MTAKQTVFLTEDRKTAVPQGDPRARFKLVHAGQEIPDKEVAKYEGAAELIQGEAKQESSKEPEKKPDPQPEPPRIETRDPETEDRDPRHSKRHR